MSCTVIVASVSTAWLIIGGARNSGLAPPAEESQYRIGSPDKWALRNCCEMPCLSDALSNSHLDAGDFINSSARMDRQKLWRRCGSLALRTKPQRYRTAAS